jgi:cold shock CspA family protein
VQGWKAGDDESLFDFCRTIIQVVSNLPDDIPEPTDPEERRRVNEEYGGVKGKLDAIGRVAHRLLLREKVLANEAAGIVRRPCPTMRARGANKLAVSKPKLDPAAPKVERSSQRASRSAPAPPESGPVVKLGTVADFSPRDWTGLVKATTGEEYPLAVGALRKSGLTTLTRGQQLEFKVIAGEADELKFVAWRR